ncbi:MAG: 30S ribosomal protein S6 [Candidatus Colwellbacteria bacterium]|nr:30S ribosomal protein S6 [Candidatus Colwellbacteria bacterium]
MEVKEQKKYEIAFLAQGEEGVGVVVKNLHRLGAEILSEESAKPISLAYPIKKHETAHFGCIHFGAGTETIQLLKDTLKFEDNILRYLIITPPFQKESSAVPEMKGGTGVAEKRRSGEQSTGGSGLSNEDLEVKLQEIRESLPEQE